MSSLLQFSGETGKQGVGLEFYLIWKKPDPLCVFTEVPTELETCAICGKQHPRLWRFWRKPIGLWGPWVVFRYLGEEQVPDLSCPLSLEKKPRGAERMTLEESCRAWHRR